MSRNQVIPLGVFAVVKYWDSPTEIETEIRRLAGGLDSELSAEIAEYLRSGTAVLALMEHTRDILDNKFDVAGGSAILTDGTFFWRRDTANYVETYQVTLSADFLEHVEAAEFVMGEYSADEIAHLDALIYGFYKDGGANDILSKIQGLS